MNNLISDKDKTQYEQRGLRRKKFKEKSLKLLIVDDNEEIRETYGDYLNPYGTVEMADDGDIAIEKIKEAYLLNNHYDVVLLDLEMERVSGDEVLRKICGKNGFEESIGVDRIKGSMFIMVTGLNDLSAIQENMRYSNVYYIGKGEASIKKEIIDAINNSLF
ncbi:MAG: response regulator [Desulfobacterales bacterium]|nr:response regulator [Desulfobacterales bacterium]